MDRMDYFEILGCGHSVSITEIKTRYHALQREYHPDTFFESPDTELKASVFVIAKRVTEAYVILRNPAKKQKYISDITGPDRDDRLRFTENTEQELRRAQRKEEEEVLGKTPQGRQLVEKALEAAKLGDLNLGRAGHQSTLTPDGLLLVFGGLCDPSHATRTIEALHQ